MLPSVSALPLNEFSEHLLSEFEDLILAMCTAALYHTQHGGLDGCYQNTKHVRKGGKLLQSARQVVGQEWGLVDMQGFASNAGI